MKSTRIQSAKLSLILLPLLLIFGTKSAIAQITPANDGTGTIVNTQNNQLNISGGTQAGSNQFHSFQQFGVNAGQTANFLSNPNIANILGRVTGGDASLINGILKVSGSNANLYLINPAGIVFGKDASLNIPAAFTATTANGIGFGNGNWFNAIGSNNYATLTANPTSFGFSGLSGSIVNAGNLSVNPGQSIALLGGTVVNTGTIAAPGGNITIAAIPGSKMVRIGQEGTVLSLDLPTSDRALINAPIATPLSLPALLTGGSVPIAMGVVVEDGVIKLTGGSASVNGTLNADGTGLQSGGNAIVYADNHLDFGGTIAAKGGELGGNGGFVDTSGKGSISIAPSAKVLTTAVKGSIGTWLIDPADLEVVTTGGTGAVTAGTNSPTTASTINASTIVSALNGTNVNLQATTSITVNEAINSSANVSAGNLKLSAPTANLNQAIALRAGSTLSGTAATVNVGATGTVQNGVDVSAAGGTVNLAAATYTLAREVGINKNVTVRGTGAGTTTVSGNNVGRVFNIASGIVTLDAMSIVNGNTIGSGGGIFNNGSLTVSNSNIANNISNYGGGLFNNRGTVTLTNSTVNGNISQSAGGGGITNYFGTLIISASTLSANAGLASSNGGGAVFSAGVLTITNSTISNNTALYYGGGIYSNGGTLTLSNNLISGNQASAGGREIYTSTPGLSNGYNLFGYGGDNGLLGITAATTDITPTVALNQIIGALANNGGTTQTHALVANSPALNAGDPTSTLTIDQRGGQRGPAGLNAGSRIDIGAYESTSSVLVTNTLDTNTTGTLRNAIGFANANTNPIATTSPTDIQFNIGTVGSAKTIALTSALPRIVKSTTIDGWTQGIAGYNGVPLITVSGENKFRVFEVGSGATVGMNGLAIVNGNGIEGGGIKNVGTLTIDHSSISGNSAFQGGGLQNNGTLFFNNSTLSRNISTAGTGGGAINYGTATFNNSTISGNSASGGIGGGIQNTNNNILTVNNSTISGNSAGNGGGGIISSGRLTIGNSIVSGNTGNLGREIYRGGGTVTSQGYNLFGYSSNAGLVGVTAATTDITPTAAVSTLLAPLGDYGGPTQTHALLPGSAAIDAGNAAANTLDQRGKARVGTADIGAFESQGFTFATSAGTPQSRTVGQDFTTALKVQVTANNAIEPVAGGIVTFTAPTATLAAPASLATAVNPATIDASGNASTIATANTKIGTYTVKANITGIATTADFALTNLADVAKNIATTSGSGQQKTVNTQFTDNLVATVTDQFGNPVSNSTVTFTVPGTGASGVFTTNTAITDANGVATIAITANKKTGLFTAQGSTTNVTGTADFALTNLADVAKNIATTSGSGQQKTVNTQFTDNLVATVTDQFGNPVSNSTVTFTVPGTGASGVFTTNTAITDANGVATIVITANTKAGLFTAKGGVSGVTGTADFSLTNLADVANAIVTTSGSNQSAVVDKNFTDNLVATVTDKFGNPVENSTVTFTVPGTGASGVFTNNTVTTNANGVATIAIKANTKAGAFTAKGQTANLSKTADFALTNTADRPASVIALTQPQTTIVAQPFPQALKTQILDQFGNPVPNTSVAFILPKNGASGTFSNGSDRMTLTTDTNGQVTTALLANNIPGTYTVTAQIQLQNRIQSTEFSLTNTLDAPNLELKAPPTQQPTIVAPNPILCVERATSAASSIDAYKGVPSCDNGISTQRLVSPQARTDR